MTDKPTPGETPPKPPRNVSVDRAFDIIEFDFSKFDDNLLEELYRRIQDELRRRGYIT